MAGFAGLAVRPRVGVVGDAVAVYEVDFLPVGDGGRSGDAITLRYTAPNPANGDWVVVVFDGGFSDDGEALVRHIKRYYGTSRVDLVVSTHPDGDHVGGLHHVLEQLTVGELLVHDPRPHLTSTAGLALDAVLELIDLADRLGVPRAEPFTGLSRFGETFQVCGPTREYYRLLLTEQLAGAGRQDLGMKSAFAAGLRALLGVIGRPVERLTDRGVTSPRNDSSAICQVVAGADRLLFTGDAGQPALAHAADRLEVLGFDAERQPIRLFQAPHHGSRRNVGPTVLDRLLGAHTSTARGACVVSAAAAADRHPNPLVVNAVGLRGYPVYVTNGQAICDHVGTPDRRGWSSLASVGFVDDSEEDDDVA